MPFRRMLSLVDAAGEVLGLTEDPLATIVGMKIEEMVDDEVDLENWDYSNSDDADICDLILGTPGGELQAVRAVKRKLQNSIPTSPKASISTLNILENCMKNCGRDFVVLVCQKDYIEDLVHIIIENEEESSKSVQVKLLALIQSWAFEYSYDRDLRGIAEVYMKLKDSGTVFPQPSEDDLKEADSEDIEAFMRAHEGEDGPVLEVLEHIMEDQDQTDSVETSTETTDEFNKFLQKRVVNVEIEALREELQKEVESLPDPVESLDDEAIIDEIDEKFREGLIGAEEEEEEVTSEEFNNFLTKRAEAVN